MQPFYQLEPLHFSCTQCGRCCATSGEYYVFLGSAEAERIRDFLGLSRAWFRRRYLGRHPDGDRVLATANDDRCVFLAADGGCRIYPVRPVQCSTYPFWPELVGSRAAWKAEARRCEGIGNGSAVSRTTIRRALRECRLHENQSSDD